MNSPPSLLSIICSPDVFRDTDRPCFTWCIRAEAETRRILVRGVQRKQVSCDPRGLKRSLCVERISDGLRHGGLTLLDDVARGCFCAIDHALADGPDLIALEIAHRQRQADEEAGCDGAERETKRVARDKRTDRCEPFFRLRSGW